MASSEMCSPISPWVYSFLVTSFHENKGPQVDFEFPKSFLPESVKNEVKLISLPKTNMNVENQCFFVFNVRIDKDKKYSLSNNLHHDFLYGYVYFQRVTDDSSKRGFSQFSCIVLSRLPLYSLYRNLSVILGSLYPKYHHKVIDLAIEAISSWPKPVIGHPYLLPLFDLCFQVCIPDIKPCSRVVPYDASLLDPTRTKRSDSFPKPIIHQNPDQSDANIILSSSYPRWEEVGPSGGITVAHLFSDSALHHIPGSIPVISSPSGEPEVDDGEFALFSEARVLGKNLPKDCSTEGYFTDSPLLRSCIYTHDILWRVWEALLLSQSLLVFCPNVSLLSKIMTAFASLIHPLLPTHDFRPYFTVYDEDFKTVESCLQKGDQGALLAGTNDPFIVEMLGKTCDVLLVPDITDNDRVLISGSIELFTGMSGIRRLLVEIEMKQSEPRCAYVQHNEARFEPFVEHWTEDIEKLILNHRSLSRETLFTKNAFLHSHLATITNNFLAPFRACVQMLKQEAIKSLPYPYRSVNEQLVGTDVWRVEDITYRHPQWLKYPFRDGAAADLMYRFSLSRQVELMLVQLKEEVGKELHESQIAWRVTLGKEQLMRLLPSDEKERVTVYKHILSEIEAERRNGKNHFATSSERLIQCMENHAKWVLETLNLHHFLVCIESMDYHF